MGNTFLAQSDPSFGAATVKRFAGTTMGGEEEELRKKTQILGSLQFSLRSSSNRRNTKTTRLPTDSSQVLPFVWSNLV